jgi:hypothetical protein
MKLALVTICCGDFYQRMAAHTHPTLRAYAERIGADFIAWDDYTGHTFPHYKKMELAGLLDTYDRLVYVDTDILIRDDAPSLFDVVPADAVGMLDESLFCERRHETIAFMERTGFDSLAWDGRYYNSGVMVMSREHRGILAPPPVEYDGVLKEQNYINAMVAKLKIKVFPLPYRFNRIYPMDSLLGESRHDSYFMHYAGARDGLTEDQVVDLIAADLELWRRSKPEYRFRRSVAFIVGGGLSEQVAAEPTVRYARDVVYPGDEVLVVSAWPDVFRHLHLPVYRTSGEIPRGARFYVRQTQRNAYDASIDRLDRERVHCVNVCSLLALDIELPQAHKRPKLQAGTAATRTVAALAGDRPPDSLVLLHPGRGRAINTFPADVWQSYCDRLVDAGHHVAVIGRRMDDAHGIVEFDRSRALDLVDKLNTSELIALIGQARALISNDSAPAQVAGAFDNWLGLIATGRHPEHVLHWRNGSQFWRARALEREPLYLTYRLRAAPLETNVGDRVDEARLRRCLPTAEEVAAFVAQAFGETQAT